VETAEVWIYGNRWQRILTALAGVWIEMIFCAIATVVWWGTPPGTYVHELAYKFMMIAGIFVIIMNMNPLIKLDGYYIFSELIQITGLKERSTEYVSTWVRRTIFGLPVEVPFVPRKQRKLFIGYAILSGIYSYLVLFIVVRIVYHIAQSYSPDWAFVPATYVAWLIFRGRFKKFGAFVRTVYLDKRELMFAKPARTFAIAAAVIVLLLLPLRRICARGATSCDRRRARPNVEPGHRLAACRIQSRLGEFDGPTSKCRAQLWRCCGKPKCRTSSWGVLPKHLRASRSTCDSVAYSRDRHLGTPK
jgi:hypothetical protein